MNWLHATGAYDLDIAEELVDTASIAVFDHYVSDGPGYAGKVMSVVWGGGSELADVFIWEDGTIECCEKD